MQTLSPNKMAAGLLLGLLSTTLFASGSSATLEKPTKPVEFEYRGDAVNGKTLATQCIACHGQDGNSMVPSFPKIAGQHARYTYKQLNDMSIPKKGHEALRPVPEMEAIVAGLSKQDMADLAAYFETTTGVTEGADPELAIKGEKIYRAGIADSKVPACIGCHQPDGSGLGLAGYPKLSGQHAAYTAAQLRAFRAAARDDIGVKHRINDGATMPMRLSAKGLSDKEILELSAYISGLKPRQKSTDKGAE